MMYIIFQSDVNERVNALYLEDASSVDYCLIVARHLNFFHLFERLHNAEVFTVNSSECRYVDVVVFKGL